MNGGWDAWTPTAAFYDTRDSLSFLFAILGLNPFFLLVFLSGLASAAHFRQQTPAIILLLGLSYNTLLNVFLKRFFRSPRPLHPAKGSFDFGVPSAHGMPSDHAQFMFFFVTWLMRRAALTGLPMSLGMRAFLISSALAVSYGRVYNSHHYPSQVVVGALIGVANAYLCTTPIGEAVLRQLAVAMTPMRDFFTEWVRFVV
ncbi:PAP2 family protein [Trypanosoma cruzi]|nr:PAP2 family protein [Trypanosoma cruzi]